MEYAHKALTQAIPGYLAGMPFPKTLAGFADLSGEDWIQLAPFLAFSFCLFFFPAVFQPKEKESGRCNTKIDLKNEKVVNKGAAPAKGEKAAYCRCWKSKKVRREREKEGEEASGLLSCCF